MGTVSLDALNPAARTRIFVQTSAGLAPAALWLNEDGLPRKPHGWQHTFDTANQRVARARLTSVRAIAHMLRHSFALRWVSVGRLLYEKRFGHLDAEELRDFRAQLGDTWYLVRTLLGHANVSTTMNVYLEPFRGRAFDSLREFQSKHGDARCSGRSRRSKSRAGCSAASPTVRETSAGRTAEERRFGGCMRAGRSAVLRSTGRIGCWRLPTPRELAIRVRRAQPSALITQNRLPSVSASTTKSAPSG